MTSRERDNDDDGSSPRDDDDRETRPTNANRSREPESSSAKSGARENRNDDALMTGREAYVIRFTYVCRSATLCFFFFSLGKGRGEGPCANERRSLVKKIRRALTSIRAPIGRTA